jgi:hypothetical protein
MLTAGANRNLSTFEHPRNKRTSGGLPVPSGLPGGAKQVAPPNIFQLDAALVVAILITVILIVMLVTILAVTVLVSMVPVTIIVVILAACLCLVH